MSPSALTVTTSVTPAGPLLVLAGDLNLATERLLREPLQTATSTAADTPHETGVTVDLRRVGFVDMSGVLLLIEAGRRLTSAARLRLLLSPGSQPDQIVRASGLDKLLTLAYAPEGLLPVGEAHAGPAAAAPRPAGA